MSEKEIVTLLIVAAGAFFLLSQGSRPAAAPGPRRVKTAGRLTVPEVFSSGGGWLDGIYVPDLLEQQYAQGWGFGD